MADRGRDVREAKLALPQAFWGRSAATIRKITAVVHPDDVRIQYLTVTRLLACHGRPYEPASSAQRPATRDVQPGLFSPFSNMS